MMAGSAVRRGLVSHHHSTPNPPPTANMRTNSARRRVAVQLPEAQQVEQLERGQPDRSRRQTERNPGQPPGRRVVFRLVGRHPFALTVSSSRAE
jgi:hypothetical protein